MLTAPFSPEEVNLALSQMHPLKSPGPYSFGVCFYQHHWSTVGDEVRKSVMDFLNLGTFDPLINSTYIVLIPKCVSASSVVTLDLLVYVMSFIS